MDKTCNEKKHKTNMLIITEGSQTEPKLLKQLSRCFPALDNFEIYSYKTNIYDLYSYLEEYLINDNDIDGDILQILMERELNDSKRLVLQKHFSDILLIFDFEPQDHRYNFKNLQVLLNVFNESTENGKLYINYPMVESFRHFKSLNDEEYIERKVALKDISKYKSLSANESCIGNIGDLDKTKFIMIIDENLKKTSHIIGSGCVYPDFDELNEDLVQVANKQNYHVLNNEFCYVLNTGLFFLPQYNSNWDNL